MHALIQPLFILVCFVLVRSTDLAISAAIGHDVVRTIAYGFVAVLAVIAVVVTLFGL